MKIKLSGIPVGSFEPGMYVQLPDGPNKGTYVCTRIINRNEWELERLSWYRLFWFHIENVYRWPLKFWRNRT